LAVSASIKRWVRGCYGHVGQNAARDLSI